MSRTEVAPRGYRGGALPAARWGVSDRGKLWEEEGEEKEGKGAAVCGDSYENEKNNDEREEEEKEKGRKRRSNTGFSREEKGGGMGRSSRVGKRKRGEKGD